MLGQFNLEQIPPAPRGVPQIEVTFDIDANGIVSVSAKDKGTNKEQKITIQASGGLSDADIEKMVKEAEENAEADKARRELVEARNHAESLVHATEKSVKEHGDKVDPTTVEVIEMSLKTLKEAMEGEDAEAIKARIQDLTEASMKLGEAIYKSARVPQAKAPSRAEPARTTTSSMPTSRTSAATTTRSPDRTNAAEWPSRFAGGPFCRTPGAFLNGQTRLLRRPRRLEGGLGNRDQEGLPPQGDGPAPRPQQGQPQR
jgi:ElaB/YqjD/DUF883 family membrane-anchored ribosome-binding protein